MFKRIANLFRGMFGQAVTSAERAHPEALLEAESENLRKQLASYNQGLISHAALCERLMAQVRKLATDMRTRDFSTTRLDDLLDQYKLAVIP